LIGGQRNSQKSCWCESHCRQSRLKRREEGLKGPLKKKATPGEQEEHDTTHFPWQRVARELGRCLVGTKKLCRYQRGRKGGVDENFNLIKRIRTQSGLWVEQRNGDQGYWGTASGERDEEKLPDVRSP